jgi:hypothetical protein
MVRWFYNYLLVYFICLPISQAQLKSALFIQNESFLSPQYEATIQKEFHFVGFKLKNDEENQKLSLDAVAVLAVGSPLLNYMNFKEAAIHFPNGDGSVLTLGRKKINWSEMDQSWALGVVEPVFKWNPLSRESQGLVGLFWRTQQTGFSLTAFASPLFIPDQGPNYEINRRGQFARKNPWFQMPPKTFQPFANSSETSEIQYKIRKPPESEIISQTSLGGLLEAPLGSSVQGRLAYLFKPMNQIGLGYNGIYNTGTDIGEVEILPQVGMHRIISSDIIFKLSKSMRFGLSYIHDRPEPFNFESEWTSPFYESASLYSSFFEFDNEKIKVRLGVFSLQDGKVSEQGELTKDIHSKKRVKSK